LRILGISAYYHDSAAALVVDGDIVGAAQEERFSRRKHDAAFPVKAVQYVLAEGGMRVTDLDAIAFYDKPLLKFERILETYHAYAPRGLRSFVHAMPVWIKEKIFMRRLLRRQLPGSEKTPLLFPEHHLSHAASAFYPSPFEEAAILTMDGVGEWATTTISEGVSGRITLLREQKFPHSLGLLYSAFTYFLGFRVNSGEYKVMGLAPYGDAHAAAQYRELILSRLVDVREDGSLLLNMDYFDFPTGTTMIRDPLWAALFGLPRRAPESPLEQAHKDLARAIQEVTGEVVKALALTAYRITGKKDLVMAGGVALNCVSNTLVAAETPFERVWIQPAAGDAGCAIGAALAAYHIGFGQPRVVGKGDAMKGAYLGPAYTEEEMHSILLQYEATFEYIPDRGELTGRVARLLADQHVVGWFQGRMEFGPRALGNRSILADPRSPDMRQHLNLKIKLREGFRPFAPSVLAEEAAAWFDPPTPSPYMLFTTRVKEAMPAVAHLKEPLPAVTHVDHSARVQTVTREANPLFHKLLEAFRDLTGCPLLVNTSFNVRGEPIVCTPEDAYLGLLRTQMDYLVLGPYLLDRKQQNPELSKELIPFSHD